MKNQDVPDELLKDVLFLVENNKVLELRELLEKFHPIDILDIINDLENDLKVKLFEVLPLDMEATLLEEGNIEFFNFILSNLDTEHKKRILEYMSLDDMANMLSKLDENEQEEVIKLLSIDDAKNVKELLVYEEESSGSIMTTGYIKVNKNMTVKEAISHMRENASEADTIYYIYVVDDFFKLVGVVSLRDLITSREEVKIENIMSEKLISIKVDEHKEEAVRLVSKYDLLAIPVIDNNKRLKGIITVDDIIDVIEEDISYDIKDNKMIIIFVVAIIFFIIGYIIGKN